METQAQLMYFNEKKTAKFNIIRWIATDHHSCQTDRFSEQFWQVRLAHSAIRSTMFILITSKDPLLQEYENNKQQRTALLITIR